MLFETIYGALDKIAKRRGIFLVETIGNCYVGACRVPAPRVDHTTVMSRFARDRLAKMNELTQKLEGTLGPGTEERGLHRVAQGGGSWTDDEPQSYNCD